MTSPDHPTQGEPATVPVPAPRGRASRPRRHLGRWLLVLGLGAAITSAAWTSIVFDPFGTASRAFERGEYASALKAAESHLRRWPGNRPASLLAARCSTRFGQRLRAEEHYRRARPVDRDDLRDRAFGLVLLNAPNRAMEAYDLLLARYPEDAQALKSLAALFMDRKDFAAAGELGERLIRVQGEEVPGRTLVGIAHHVHKEYEAASEQFEQVLRIDPALQVMPLPRPLFWDHLSIDLMAQGRDREARDYLVRALERDQDAGLMELLGLTYHRQGATGDAQRCWRKALELDPRNANAWIDLGRLALAERPSEAVDLLEKAAELIPGSIEVQHNLGMAYRLVGDAAASVRSLRKASELRGRQPGRGQAIASPDVDRAGPGPGKGPGS